MLLYIYSVKGQKKEVDAPKLPTSSVIVFPLKNYDTLLL